MSADDKAQTGGIVTRKLKVYCAVAGFDNAYVAAPSRKAALEAWGADHDLFARGQAEVVTDPGLTAEPLAHPGKVIRKSRGDLEEQLKALGPKAGKAKAEKEKAGPPPSRAKVDAAERALDEARARHARREEAIEGKRAMLLEKLKALRAKQQAEIGRLEQRREQARQAYQEALRRWSGS